MIKRFFIISFILLKTILNSDAQTCTACFTYSADTINPNVINFDASCSNATPGSQYDWQFDGFPLFSSIQPSFQLPFFSAGTHLITLTLFDGVCVDTFSQVISISPVCYAGFIPYSYTTSAFYFNATGYYSPTATYTWDFGDGTTGSGSSATHNYTATGSYNVCFSVVDSGCTDSQCQMVTVNSITSPGACIASFTYYLDTLIGLIYADASGSSFDPLNTMFSWELNGSLIQQSTSPYLSTILPAIGNYSLTLTLTDLNLVTCSATSQAFSYNSPIFSSCYSCFNYSYNATYDSVYLTSCSQIPPGGSLLWYVNGNTFSNNGSTFIQGFPTSGAQSIALYVLDSTSNICDSSFQYIYTYSPPCTSCFSINPVPGSTSDYVLDGSCSALTYAFNWFVDGNYVMTSYSPQFTYSFNQSGTYNVCMQSMDSIGNYCTQTCSSVTVNTPTTTNFDLAGRIYKYNSMFNLAPATSGEAKVYLIKLITGGQLDAIDSTTTNASGYYSFNNKPIDDYRIKVALNPSSPDYGMNIPTYYNSSLMWYDAQVITLFGNTYNRDVYMQYGINAGGNGFISGNVFAGANKQVKTRSQSMDDVTIILKDVNTNAPIAYAKPDASGNYSFSNIPYGSYKMMGELLNRASIPNTITLSAAQSSLSNKNFVFNNAVIQPTDASLSTEDDVLLSELVIVPNPAVNQIEMTSFSETRMIRIFDLTGREVSKFDIKGGTKKLVDCSSWNKGIYLVQSESKGKRISQRLLIQ